MSLVIIPSQLYKSLSYVTQRKFPDVYDSIINDGKMDKRLGDIVFKVDKRNPELKYAYLKVLDYYIDDIPKNYTDFLNGYHLFFSTDEGKYEIEVIEFKKIKYSLTYTFWFPDRNYYKGYIKPFKVDGEEHWDFKVIEERRSINKEKTQ